MGQLDGQDERAILLAKSRETVSMSKAKAQAREKTSEVRETRDWARALRGLERKLDGISSHKTRVFIHQLIQVLAMYRLRSRQVNGTPKEGP
jgi:hypothetical protein